MGLSLAFSADSCVMCGSSAVDESGCHDCGHAPRDPHADAIREATDAVRAEIAGLRKECATLGAYTRADGIRNRLGRLERRFGALERLVTR